MKAYSLVWSAAAEAAMRKLDVPIRRRIHAKMTQVVTDPGRFSLRLVNSPYSRVRVGDWRVIIHIDRGIVQVLVIEINHRSRAYD